MTFHSLQNRRSFLLERTLQKGNAVLSVKFHIGCKVVCNGSCRLAEHIGHNGIQCHIADRKSVLETVLFTALHGDELIAVAGQFPKDANFLIGDKTAFDKANAK